MKRAWPLLALAALAAGGCGQKGPLYLPDKGGRVVTSAPAATQAQPAPPKPGDKDKTQDQDSQPPK